MLQTISKPERTDQKRKGGMITASLARDEYGRVRTR
jgi:hypothetical protein